MNFINKLLKDNSLSTGNHNILSYFYGAMCFEGGDYSGRLGKIDCIVMILLINHGTIFYY